MSSSKRTCSSPSSLQEMCNNFLELHDDILFNVLSRLPTKYMPRLKCVCKGWNRLISDPIFKKVQSQTKGAVSGFLVQRRKHVWCSEDITTINYIPVGKQVAGLFQTVFDFLPEHVVVLTSSNGLVCCRSCFRRIESIDPCLYICNPLNHECIRLKWDEPGREDNIALAFDPCTDLLGTSAKFKLIRVKKFQTETKEFYFSFDMYSSDTWAWKKSEEICKCNSDLYKNKEFYVEGILYWLTDGDELLTFDVENQLSRLISLPLLAIDINSKHETCIGDSDGRLHYIIFSQYGFQVWLLEDYFNSKWSLKLSKNFQEMEEQHIQFLYNLHKRVTRWLPFEPWIDLLAFKDGYLLMRVSINLVVYDTKRNKMQLVCSLYEVGIGSISSTGLPYSLSLVPLNQA